MKIQVQKIKVFKLKNYTLKDAECNICKIKFKKHDLIRHKNSCQAKAATKKNCRMNFIYLFHLALNFI
jgi:hypothetical protein